MEANELLNTIDFRKYRKLVDQLRLKSCNVKGGELHHIVPKSMGGSNLPDNLVRVTRENHKLLHVVLSECLDQYDPDNDWARKMRFAVDKMHNSKVSSKFKKDRKRKRISLSDQNKKLKARVVFLEKQLDEALDYINQLEGF